MQRVGMGGRSSMDRGGGRERQAARGGTRLLGDELRERKGGARGVQEIEVEERDERCPCVTLGQGSEVKLAAGFLGAGDGAALVRVVRVVGVMELWASDGQWMQGEVLRAPLLPTALLVLCDMQENRWGTVLV